MNVNQHSPRGCTEEKNNVIKKFPHKTTKEAACNLLQAAVSAYATKFALNKPVVSWASPERADVTAKVLNLPVSGAFVVTDTDLEVHVEIPPQFKVFEPAAVAMLAQVVEQQLAAWHARAKIAAERARGKAV